MKLTIYSRTFRPFVGGLERVSEIVAKGLSREGVQVKVVTATPLSIDESEEPAPYQVVRSGRLPDWVREFAWADAVLIMNVSFPGLVAALVARRPFLICHHGAYDVHSWSSFPKQIVRRRLASAMPGIAVSRFVATQIGGRLHVIPNGYDDKLFNCSPPRDKRYDFVFCGRLVSDKGCDLALRAFSHVIKRFPGASFSVIGSGSEEARLQSVVDKLGISASVRFTGTLQGKELVSELSQHRCMIVPSLWEEPFGLAALEGLACCGLVIVTEKGGLPEAVGKCGRVVQATINGLSGAMSDLLKSGFATSDEERAEIRRHLNEHRSDRMVEAYHRVLRRFIAGTRIDGSGRSV